MPDSMWCRRKVLTASCGFSQTLIVKHSQTVKPGRSFGEAAGLNRHTAPPNHTRQPMGHGRREAEQWVYSDPTAASPFLLFCEQVLSGRLCSKRVRPCFEKLISVSRRPAPCHARPRRKRPSLAASSPFGERIDACTNCFDRDRLPCRRWRCAIANHTSQMGRRFSVRLHQERRAGFAQCSRLAGKCLPQHSRSWLIASGGPEHVNFDKPEPVANLQHRRPSDGLASPPPIAMRLTLAVVSAAVVITATRPIEATTQGEAKQQ